MIRIGTLLVVLLAAACSGSSTTAPGADGPNDGLDPTGDEREFTLAIGERTTVPEADLEVAFVEVVSDSRCPVDVTCVWQGDGEVAVEVVQSGREVAATLHTGVEPTAFELGGWRVRLVGLDPAPREGQPIPPESYRASFGVAPVEE